MAAAWIGLPCSGSSLKPPSSVAPMAPTAAAPVGVATPARIEPSTATMSTMCATKACMRRSTMPCEPSASSSAGIAGEPSGRSQAINT